MKYWKYIVIALGLIPFSFIISLLTLYFHAGQLLGHLPIANSDDPKNSPIYLMYEPLIDVTGNIWIFSFIAWTVVVGLYLALCPEDDSKRLIIFSAIGHVLAIILFCSKINEWYMD
jgi:hypothetical protein